MIARIEVDAETMDKNIALSLRLAGYTIKEHINREGTFPYIDTYICQKIVETAIAWAKENMKEKENESSISKS